MCVEANARGEGKTLKDHTLTTCSLGGDKEIFILCTEQESTAQYSTSLLLLRCLTNIVVHVCFITL
jgi:hypothetical protein